MELRKDYVLDRWVIISENRNYRPNENKEKKKKRKVKFCPFCPENEAITPPEIYRLDEGDHWKIRAFENKFPAVALDGQAKIETHNKYFTFSNSYGKHEIIVETPEHKPFSDLKSEEIKKVFDVYNLRIKELYKLPKIKYVQVFKNSGKKSGESIGHSHSQLIAYNKIPHWIEKEVEASEKKCPYCEIIEIEKNSDRRCFENEFFVAFTPYASRFPYEIWIFPKEHIKNFDEMNNSKRLYLAEILKKVLMKLRKMDASYNYAIHYAPKDKDLHFHIEIYPRISIWGGFELGTGDIINTVSPEDAARFYRSYD